MRRKGKTVTPSIRLQAKGELSILLTNTKNQCRKFISHADLSIKMLSGNQKIIFFQTSAVNTGLFSYMDATLLALDTPTGFIFKMVNTLELISSLMKYRPLI